MVKKTYISPAALTVQLGTVQMMAESLDINTNSYDPTDESTYVSSSDQVLTKENKSLWDNEW
ncbi:MAG: hypothetical protein IJ219_05385 [Bacteroidaceae bacterium]|nr:hypothetical protein [Bacteroidaceae bacterium]MBQ9171298.1 hypothetical protein [Bacteroidaceae bacterium]MBQ9294346.1 hypothetical protein [Bacteroidaceae bacterium]